MTETPSARKNRTNKQNAYLWSGVYPVLSLALHNDGVKTIGGKHISDESVHEWCKGTFAAAAIIEDAVETGRTPTDGELRNPSTSTMTAGAMAIYLRMIQEHFALRGIDIEDPDEARLAVYGKKVKCK